MIPLVKIIIVLIFLIILFLVLNHRYKFIGENKQLKADRKIYNAIHDKYKKLLDK